MIELATAADFRIAISCKICHRQKNPGDFMTRSEVRGNICSNCYDWHLSALQMMNGSIPKGCQVCNQTFAQLAAIYPGDHVPMYLQPLDGIYQILCPTCSDDYEKKSPTYKETLYGKLKKLAGFK
jgi:hypothetical protein